MFDTRIDKDNAVNGSGKNMLKMAVLEQIVRFEDEIEGIKKERIDTGGPFVYHDPFGGIPQRRHYETNIAPHHFKGRVKHTDWTSGQKGDGKPPWIWITPYKCIRCGYTTENVSDIRLNKGCNMFSRNG